MPKHPIRSEIRLLDGRWYQREPLSEYRWMRDHAPLYFDPEAGLWAASRYADVMAISKDPERFSSAAGSRPDSSVPSMINMDDPQHKRRRKLVNRGFTPKQLAQQEIQVRQICRELIDRVAPRGECEFVREVAAPLPMIRFPSTR